MINRTVLLTSLSKKFSEAYEKAITHFSTEDKIHLTDTLMEISVLYKDTEANQEKIKSIHTNLLNRYRKRLKPLIDAGIYSYFDKESILMLHGIEDNNKYLFSTEEFNKMEEGQQTLTDIEYDQHITRINNHLSRERQEFYLSLEPEEKENDRGSETSKPDKGTAETGKPATTNPTHTTTTTNKDDEDLITTREAVIMLKVSKVTLQKWRDEGQIPFLRMGTRIRFKKSEVIEAMRRRGGRK